MDQREIDIKKFRRWVDCVAARASVGRSPRSKLTVTVQRGRFRAKQIERLRKHLRYRFWDARINIVAPDDRLYVTP
jgi:hypothetical protein